MTRYSTFLQFLRYALVGLLSNAILYVVYLFFTWFGMGPKLAMTILYGVGVAQTFLFNKRWTFGHGGAHGSTFVRYCVAYGVGYIVNFLVMVLLIDQLRYPHQIVQGVMVLVLAVLLFLMQKFWVFRSQPIPG